MYQYFLSEFFTCFLKVEGGAGVVNDVANTMMQKFWDSALALEPSYEEFDTQRCYACFIHAFSFLLTNMFDATENCLSAVKCLH